MVAASTSGVEMSRIAVFDINETTLDLAPIRQIVDRLVGSAGGFTVWFQRLLQLSMTSTFTDTYADFTTLARAALYAVADTVEQQLPDSAWDQLAAAFGTLDPYPDVQPGLSALRSAGWTVVALTNSASVSVEAQLARADLTRQFDLILSVDAVRSFKPAAAPYLYTAEQIGMMPSELWMVACHDWDLAGARAVGMSTAFVARPGMSYAANHPDPELSAVDFIDLANQLIQQQTAS